MLPGADASGLKVTVRVALACLCICVAATAHGQSSNSTRGTSSTVSPVPNGSGTYSGAGMPSVDQGYEEPKSFRILRQNARRDEIKRNMAENATRLLRLTAELRNELQTREPTEADSKRLDEIAKLAHAVREQMKQ
jgi:hypothetical protein